jgi:hypothetical protein
LIPELATLRPASLGIRTAGSDVNGFFEALAQQDSSKALISMKEKLDMSVCLDKFPNHQKGASQWTQSMNHGL